MKTWAKLRSTSLTASGAFTELGELIVHGLMV